MEEVDVIGASTARAGRGLPPLLLGLLVGCGGETEVLDPTTLAGVERIALVGARLIDGSGGPPIEPAALLIADGRIVAVGPEGSFEIPDGVERTDLAGKTVIPGLINAHGHVGTTRGLESGSEHYTEDNVRSQLRLYASYGVTTVASLGGGGEAGVRVRNAQRTSSQLDGARLLLAGPVVTAATPEEARQQVAAVSELGADLVKIRVDDNLGRTTKMSPEVYGAVIDEAHSRGLPLAAHLFYLEDAKGLLRAGADLLAHSVRDAEVDDELVELLLETGVCLVPTLTREVSTFVYESVPEFFEDPFFLRSADPAVLEALRDPERQRRVQDSAATPVYKAALETASRNLVLLARAGVPIAFGTDSGPPARFQGYFEHLEAELMAQAGLEPMEILLSATRDAAACLALDDLGTLAPGKWADLVVLDADPLEDIRNLREIHSVWVGGERIDGDPRR